MGLYRHDVTIAVELEDYIAKPLRESKHALLEECGYHNVTKWDYKTKNLAHIALR
jgi:hypothetical protein